MFISINHLNISRDCLLMLNPAASVLLSIPIVHSDIQIVKKRYTDVHNDARMLRASRSEMSHYDMFLRS